MTAAVQLLSSLYHLCTNALIVLHCISPQHLKWPSLIISSNRSHPYAHKGSSRSENNTHTYLNLKLNWRGGRGGGVNKSYGSPLEYLASRLKLQYWSNLFFILIIFLFLNQVVYSMANVCIILAEHTKVVHRLGSKFPVAVSNFPLCLISYFVSVVWVLHSWSC